MGISFAQDQMAVLLQVHAKTGFLKIIDDFLSPPQKADANFNHVVPNTLMQATLRDSALSEYLKFIQTNGGSEIRDSITDFFGGVLLRIEDMDSASGLTFATLGYTNGLPDVVMGLAGKQPDLENFVSHMQMTKRLERDNEILEEAMAKAQNQKATTAENPIAMLEDRGLLVETSQAL